MAPRPHWPGFWLLLLIWPLLVMYGGCKSAPGSPKSPNFFAYMELFAGVMVLPKLRIISAGLEASPDQEV